MAEAQRNTQLPSGFDEEFVYEVEDDCICVICQLPLKEPVLTRCGHRFCNACLGEHLRRYTYALSTEFYLMLSITLIRKLATLNVKYELRHCVPLNTWTSRQRKSELHLLKQTTVSLVDILVEDNVSQVTQLKFFTRGLEGKRKNLY